MSRHMILILLVILFGTLRMSWAACNIAITAAGPVNGNADFLLPKVGDCLYGLRVNLAITGTPAAPMRIVMKMCNQTNDFTVNVGAGTYWWWTADCLGDLAETNIPWSITLDPDNLCGNTNFANNSVSGTFTPRQPSLAVETLIPRAMSVMDSATVNFVPNSGTVGRVDFLFGQAFASATQSDAQNIVFGPASNTQYVITQPDSLPVGLARWNALNTAINSSVAATQTFDTTLWNIRVNTDLLNNVSWDDLTNSLPADLQMWRDEVLYPASDPNIAAFVNRHLPGNYRQIMTPYAAAKALLLAEAQELHYCPIPSGTSSFESLSTLKIGTCGDFSEIYVAALRHIGFAARVRAGWWMDNLTDNLDITNNCHVWTEFYLPGCGWIFVDPTACESDDSSGRYAYCFGEECNSNMRIAVSSGGDIIWPGQSFNAGVLQVPNWIWTGGAKYSQYACTLSLVPQETSRLIMENDSVFGGMPLYGYVYIKHPVSDADIQVQLTASDPNVTLPTTITIPAGGISGSFYMDTSGVSSPDTVQIQATLTHPTDGVLTDTAAVTLRNTLDCPTMLPSPLTQQVQGSPVNLVTTAVDGENVQYCFEVSQDGVNWQTIGSGWSSARSITWIPNACSSFYLQSVVQESGGATPQSASAPVAYLISAPLISSCTPSSGGPGTVVTITGTNFTGATAVAFGGTAASSFTVVSDSSITATVGNGDTGIITITLPNGSAISGNRFIFCPAPAVTSFSPSSGGAGTGMTITGVNFTGATAVTFGGTAAASFTVTNDSTIIAAVGSGGTGTISVTTPGGKSTSTGAYTFSSTPAPAIASYTPNSGGAGTVVTITGANFTGSTAVAFGGMAAVSFTVVSATTITATVGSGYTGGISVTTPGGTVVSSGIFTCSSAAGPGDWWLFHHDLQHTGRSPFSGPASPVPQWTYPTGAIFCSSPALGADGTIYCGSWDDNLYAINPDGALRWVYPTGASIWSSPAIGADGIIYVGSNDDNLYAINPDGTQKWAFFTGELIFSSPAIGADGTIYVGSWSNDLYAINPDGTQKWVFHTGNPVYSSPALGVDGTIYLGSEDDNLYAINPDGTQKWAFLTGAYVDSSPAIGADGTIYVGSNDQNLYAINPDGTQKWAFLTGGFIYSSPAVGADGTIYIGSCDDVLYAVSPDGTFKWGFPTGDHIYASSPALGADGTIYCGSCDNNLYAVNPNGTRQWAFSTERPISSSPAIGANGIIYVGSEDNNLYAIGGPPSLAPAITSFTPSGGGTKTGVTITGSNLTGATAVAFGGTAAASFTVASATSITATVGNGATGTITVTTPGGTATSSGVFTYTPPLSGVTLNATPSSPAMSGTQVNLLATASGGTNVSFQFWIYNPAATPAWSQLQAYSTTAGCTWTPAAPGNYLLSVTAQDGVTGTEVNTTAWYTISGALLTAVSVAASPAAPQKANTPITLTATATGGVNVQYQFWQYNPQATPAWSQLQAYSPQAVCTWLPPTAGNYLLSITAKDGASGTEVNSTAWYAIIGDTPLTAVSVTPSLPSPQAASTLISLTASATGGTRVQYQFWLYNPASTPAWNQLQTYSTQAICAWTPATAGNYLLSITARDSATATEVNTTCWYTITGGSPLTAVNATSSPASPQPANMPITLTAMATGGTNVQYQFWQYNPLATPAWSQLQAYASQATCTWTPTMAGNYLLSITARDGVTGKEVTYTLWYAIISGSPLTAVNVTTSPASPQAANTPITLTATATGGTNVQYQFWQYNPNATPAWSQLQAYASQATCTWTPNKAGSYLLSVTARDGVTGTEVNATFWYSVQ